MFPCVCWLFNGFKKGIYTLKSVKTITIGNVLRELRKNHNISQEEVAGRTGLDRTFISMLERDIKQPSITTIFLLSEAFEMKSSELVKLIEDEYSGVRIERDTN